MTTTKLLQDMIDKGESFGFSYLCKECLTMGAMGIMSWQPERNTVLHFAKLAEEQYKLYSEHFECETEGCNSTSAWFAINGEEGWRQSGRAGFGPSTGQVRFPPPFQIGD